MKNRIHKLSEVQTANIGPLTYIWQFTVVLKGAVIGDECNVCSHCFIENDVIIGDRVTIKAGVQLWDGVRIEDDAFIGPNVTFTNDLKPRSKQPYVPMITTVKRGASIGANSTILPGITVGEDAMIGAGSVVLTDIPPNTLWVGNPAKQIKKI